MAKRIPPRKGTGTRAQARAGQADARMMMSLDINTGVEKLRPEDLLQREMPSSVQDAFKRARGWIRDNWFVEQILFLQQSFYNFGLEFDVKRKGRTSASHNNKDKDVALDLATERKLRRLVGEVWGDWLGLDTVVGFYREEKKTQPFLFPPEDCEYTDRFGIERLAVTLNYKKSELDGEGDLTLSEDEKRRYTGAGKRVLLDPAHDEYFSVMTRGRKGYGFGWPRMRTLFRTCSTNEHMEVGESQLAYLGRMVERQHKIGFEVRSGANAMRQTEYLWKKKRADEIQKFYQGRAGATDTVKQFDQFTSYVFVPPEGYDGRKWETFVNRAIWWGGPLAFMYLAKTVNPQLLKMLEAMAMRERQDVGLFCEQLIAEGFEGLPGEVRLKWDDKIFRDERLAWDMLKAGMLQGPVSLKTVIEQMGLDPDEEAENKREEAAESRREELVPLYDPHHNKGEQSGKEAGRPTTKTGNKE